MMIATLKSTNLSFFCFLCSLLTLQSLCCLQHRHLNIDFNCVFSDLPYSHESRDVFPLWEELAEALKEREDVVVARIDASANDINLSMQGAYPSLCLFPALHAERVGCIFSYILEF